MAAILKELVAAGLSGDQLIAAFERIEAATPKTVDEAAQKRREWDRQRKAEQRAAKKTDLSTRLPPDPVDIGGIPPDKPPLARVEVPTLLKEVVKEERKKEARGRTIPGDWQPKDRHFVRGEARGLRHQAVVALGERMRNWGEANRNRAIARKADWDKTFDGFIDREATGPPTNGHAAPEPTFRFEDLPDYYEAMKRAGREQ